MKFTVTHFESRSVTRIVNACSIEQAEAIMYQAVSDGEFMSDDYDIVEEVCSGEIANQYDLTSFEELNPVTVEDGISCRVDYAGEPFIVQEYVDLYNIIIDRNCHVAEIDGKVYLKDTTIVPRINDYECPWHGTICDVYYDPINDKFYFNGDYGSFLLSRKEF